ncbi:MAG: DUF116 domain-containing protein [Methanobacteriaceae archaeon]|jgi:hypothetical protein|nr:DUF116 domain-containing protein [Candidatus Methanorudis spinitermitis]
MKTITYNLNLENLEDYYSKIRKFTDNVLNESKIAIGDIVYDFQKYLCENPPQNVYLNEDFKKKYNYEEHVFELLFLGLMWKNYIEVAINLDSDYQEILAKLVDLRNEKNIVILEDNGNTHIKEKIDEIRGLLAYKHLLNNDIKNILNFENNYKANQNLILNKNKININNFNKDKNHINDLNKNKINIINLNKNKDHINDLNKNKINIINFDMKNYNLLLNYLKATGDWEESLKHLLIWKEFFQKHGIKLDICLKKILSFANWFEKVANDELYNYTVNVDKFRENQLENHINNEDIIFCARNKIEYYLNMFGAEVMNRVFRYKFEKRDKIAIFLPKCM